MYELFGLFLGVVMFCLGLFMAVCSKAATKKEFRDDISKVSKTRTSGIVIMICGILLIILRFFLM